MKLMENTDKIYSLVIESAYGLSIGAVWQHIRVDCSEISDDYLFRKQMFFDFLTRALTEGKIKLATKGVFLSGSISEQLNLFQTAWPQYPSDDEDDELDESGMWFFVKAPAGLVWLTPDGEEIWT
ncbi:DUF596 domain-containing protein [Klebsiella sp. BIGb0407]|uniref:DUF596 domain-containing protein n=1 Tax=Klebsiella sp. BIGb0407 TaxID=2940603 RepID=UPI0021698E92|nr:DUF596 domain-containing protein [Klebsiella sp. BIGb0407]MCS3430695.1 hypothetical protein [Klebsiella sp. BIGb0407]